MSTYKEKVISFLKICKTGATCAECVKFFKLAYEEDKNKGNKQLMGTVSGVIYKLHAQGEINISPVSRGIRGGKKYYI